MTFVKEKTFKKKRQRPPEPLTPEQLKDKRHRERMKDRAAILSIEPLGNGKYRVWGGEGEHIVQATIDDLVSCDCLGWSKARHGVCSHVYKYLVVYGRLKK